MECRVQAYELYEFYEVIAAQAGVEFVEFVEFVPGRLSALRPKIGRSVGWVSAAQPTN
jgi:hypothetical protein